MKSVSRRSFLGEGIAEALAVVGIGLGAIGIASPGPNSQSFTDAYVQKKPPSRTANTLESQADSDENLVLNMRNHNDNPGDLKKQWVALLRRKFDDKAFWALSDSGMVMASAINFASQEWNPETETPSVIVVIGATESIDSPGTRVGIFGSGQEADDRWNNGLGFDGSGYYTLNNSLRFQGTRLRYARITNEDWFVTGESGNPPANDTVGGEFFIDGLTQRWAWRRITSPTTKDLALRTTDGFTLPTAFFPVAVGAGFPLNQAIVQINNNWTLRRLWVRCATGPVGGTETYAVVNAAGVVQGTAVTLAAGGLEVIGALQTTNLTSGTKYYLAQTAVGAGWAAGSTNTHLSGEYNTR